MNTSISVLLSSLFLSILIPFFHIVLNMVFGERRNDFLCMLLACSSYLSLVVFYIMHQAFSEVSLAIGVLAVIFMSLIYAEFFSMVCRGFSLNILVTLYASRAITIDELCKKYGGNGMQWMLTKRLLTMQNLNIVSIVDEKIILRGSLGGAIGRFSLLYKRLLNLPRGG